MGTESLRQRVLFPVGVAVPILLAAVLVIPSTPLAVLAGLAILGALLAHLFRVLGRAQAERQDHLGQLSDYSALLESAPCAAFLCDRRGVIETVNSSFERLTGMPRAEAEGRMLRILDRGRQEATLAESIWRTLERGQAWSGRHTNQRKDGSAYEEEVRISPVLDDARALTALVGIARDVTQAPGTEERLLHQQRMATLGELAGGAAHEFNNLLTAILGNSSILKMHPRDPERILTAAEVIEQAARGAVELTERLLGLSQRSKFEAVAVDIHATIREVVALLARTIDRKITIRQELRAESALVAGDRDQLRQIVLNLALNARDALSTGEPSTRAGRMTFKTELREVDEAYCRTHKDASPGRFLMVSVSDTGGGIAEATLDRIIQPFLSTQERGEISGMSLAIVYAIVRNHGGWVELSSSPGEGSTYSFSLPLARGADQCEPVDLPAKGAGVILVVDDEEAVRTTAAALLRELGYEVRLAADGHQAIETYRKHRLEIDLILLDMIMPHMGGRECFHDLKKINPDVKAILSSGYGLNGEAQKMLDEGMAGFLQKPYRVNELSRAIADALGRRSSSGEPPRRTNPSRP
jgi:PAS domain S-box-containing protein